MSDRIRKFIQLQAIKKRFEPENTDAPVLTDSDRIDALEDAVLALASNAPKEATAHIAKLYDNMVKLDKIDITDVPANFKPDVEGVLLPKEKPNDIRKEAAM